MTLTKKGKLSVFIIILLMLLVIIFKTTIFSAPSITRSKTNSSLPSFSSLEKSLDSSLVDLGSYQITAAVFQDDMFAILENKEGNQLKFDIKAVAGEKLMFSLQNTTPDINKYNIGETLNLAEHNQHYYLYAN